ncbi:12367_t:CDS:2, partial [Racocetra fulgida]
KKEDIDKNENKVSNKDMKPDTPSCETSLFKWFWNNMSCDDSAEKEEIEVKKNNNGDKAADGKAKFIRIEIENFEEIHEGMIGIRNAVDKLDITE